MDTQRNPFQEIDHVQGEEHPIDASVREHPAVKVIAKKIRTATEQLQTALQKKDEESLWISLEALLNEYLQAREEVVFNTGFQYGHVDGEAKSIQLLMGKSLGKDYRRLADHLRDVTIQSGLSPSLGVAALLEIAWAVSLGVEQE
jgi:hypothetical protein